MLNSKLTINNIYTGKQTINTYDWTGVTIEFGGKGSDVAKIIPIVIGFQVYDGNHVPNVVLTAETAHSFSASCYGIAAFKWMVIELI